MANIQRIKQLIAHDLTDIVSNQTKRFPEVIDALDAESFPTKARQQDLLDLLNRAYQKQNELIQRHLLNCREQGEFSDNPQEFDNLYYSRPHDLHNWRPKHAAMYSEYALTPVNLIDGLFEMRTILKGKPVVKKTAQQIKIEKMTAPGARPRIQLRAICSCCGRDIAVNKNGVIAQHGYTKSWHGFKGSSDCWGSGFSHFGTKQGLAVAQDRFERAINNSKQVIVKDANGKRDERATVLERRAWAQEAEWMKARIDAWKPAAPVKHTIFD